MLDHASVLAAFQATYSGAYGRLLDAPVRVLNLRSAVIGLRPKIDLLSMAPARDASLNAARRPPRRVHLGSWHDAAVFDRLALPVGAVISGPAILEQPDTTILILPGQHGRVDRFGNILLEEA